MTSPNSYLRQFLSTNFDSYIKEIKITDDLTTTKIPAVEIPLAPSLVADIYNHCVANVDKFRTIRTANLYSTWYNPQRNSGWTEIALTVPEVMNLESYHNSGEIKFPEANRSNYDSKVHDLCNKLLAPYNLDIIDLKLSRLEPNGWIQPHRDKYKTNIGLTYFWIPLHDFAPCLKLFPYGWLQHRVGYMYLFNHSTYIHAVHNNTHTDRYTLLGKFNPATTPAKFIEIYNNTKLNYSRLWKA